MILRVNFIGKLTGILMTSDIFERKFDHLVVNNDFNDENND